MAESEVKDAVTAFLADLDCPFEVTNDDPGHLEAKPAAVGESVGSEGIVVQKKCVDHPPSSTARTVQGKPTHQERTETSNRDGRCQGATKENPLCEGWYVKTLQMEAHGLAHA
jgi:hypothetical protein